MPDDGTIKVVFAEMQQAADDITRVNSQLAQRLDDLEGELGRMVWTGDDQQAFVSAQNQWRSSMHDMSEVLKAIPGAITEAVQVYQDAARKSLQGIQNLQH
jgi:WXG100 family type VII secretion target